MAANVATDLAVDRTDTNSIGAADADSGHALFLDGNGDAKERDLEGTADSVDVFQLKLADVARVVAHGSAPLLTRANPVIWEQLV